MAHVKSLKVVEHACKRGFHKLCPLTKLLVRKTGALAAEVALDGSVSKVPETEIVYLVRCSCTCHE